jgi:hypothetical protein
MPKFCGFGSTGMTAHDLMAASVSPIAPASPVPIFFMPVLPPASITTTPSLLGQRASWLHAIAVLCGFTGFFCLFFAPILWGGWLLAAEGDGLVYYLPAYLSKPQLWTDLLFGGYPIAADPQNMTWYPLAMLLRLIPHSWNAFVLLGYVLAASFAYCYGWITTGSRFAAAGAGLVYGLCGYMIGHYGHITMVHAAAWIPLIFVALEKLRQRSTRGWWVIGWVSVACCFLGGHPQIPSYGLGLAVIYALIMGWQAPIGRWAYYRLSASILAIGLGLCALQLLPTLELSRLSVRSAMDFASFSSFSLPRWQAIQMVFPYLFGGANHLYGKPYWGGMSLVEAGGYVGLMPLGLAVIALRADRPQRLVWFWAIVGVVAFLLMMGGDTPLGHLLFRVPVYQKFRAQGRHAIEVGLAASALTAFGIASIQRGLLSARSLQRIMLGLLGVLCLSWLGLCSQQGFYQTMAQQAGVTLELRPWLNPAIGVPFLTCGIGTLTLLIWQRRHRAQWGMALVGAALVWDLISFAGFHWHSPTTVKASYVQANPAAQFLQPLLAAQHQRLITTQGSIRTERDRLSSNLTRLWQLPNASGYTPLMMSRVSELLQLNSGGAAINTPTLRNRSWDLMAVRYALVLPTFTLPTMKGLTWGQLDLGLMAGTGTCSFDSQPSIRLSLAPTDLPVSQLGIVSSLGCAVTIPNNQVVAEIKAIATDGSLVTGQMRAGRDTAEWAYDCPDVKPVMQHQRPPLFRQVPVERQGRDRCPANAYTSQISLDQTKQITHLEIQPRPNLRLGINHLVLMHPGNQSSQVSPFELRPDVSGDTTRWQAIQRDQNTTLYENKLAMPRAWLVSELVQAEPAVILQSIQKGQLPDGKAFDPNRVAFVENAVSQKLADLQSTDIAKVVTIADTQVKIQTQTTTEAFLILSDVNYPGWQVTIDGKPATLLPVNYLQRGVRVPAGTHLVQFAFRPMSFRIGAGITVGTLFLAGLIGWRGRLFHE